MSFCELLGADDAGVSVSAVLQVSLTEFHCRGVKGQDERQCRRGIAMASGRVWYYDRLERADEEHGWIVSKANDLPALVAEKQPSRTRPRAKQNG